MVMNFASGRMNPSFISDENEDKKVGTKKANSEDDSEENSSEISEEEVIYRSNERHF